MTRIEDACLSPLRLSADNFTPLTRTPWGGDVIGRRYKKNSSAAGRRIGEAWEFSCDPAFPSRVVDLGLDLLTLVERAPELVLSPELQRLGGGRGCEILVKLLNAAEPLSLQVHPADADLHLKADECGKPESWLVLAAEPGAGIYLGFSRAVSRAELRQALLDGERAKALLNFVPVKPGDYFEIEPGVPHAIGGGVTLLEPQRIVQGKAGKTYRLWDWGRKYDAQGALDMERGTARPLHVEESLPLVDPERQVGPAFISGLRRQPRLSQRPGGVKVREFPANPYYRTLLMELPPRSCLELGVDGGYGALVVLEGEVEAQGKTSASVRFPAGQPGLLPHAAMPVTFRTGPAAGELALIVPASARLAY